MKVLDLFCGAGGAAMGLHRAWPDAEIIGVDIKPQPRYPFTFVQADAMEFPLDGYDFIWASPPCQDHMETPHKKHGTGWMLPATRARLYEAGRAVLPNGHIATFPWVIENVRGAPLRADFICCGCQFGLPNLRRERWFETRWPVDLHLQAPHDHREPAISVVGHGTPSWVRAKLGRNPTIAEYRAAMGIDWMNRDELSQAVPPAYSEYIARQLTPALTVAA